MKAIRRVYLSVLSGAMALLWGVLTALIVYSCNRDDSNARLTCPANDVGRCKARFLMENPEYKLGPIMGADTKTTVFKIIEKTEEEKVEKVKTEKELKDEEMLNESRLLHQVKKRDAINSLKMNPHG